MARDLGERGGPPVPGEELDQVENVGGLLDVHGSAMEQAIGGSKAAVILPDAASFETIVVGGPEGRRREQHADHGEQEARRDSRR